ncbi:Malonyl-(acyl-carrier protein) O-methyltransferase [Burkholderiales bacterium]|nr:Malonyl-(acyl-carrier protein) O-methyltransferase [Burkholderiales bacterium]
MIPTRVDASIATVRRQFEMRAARFAVHDAIVREVSARMLGRLSCVRHRVTRLVDLGCGRGACRAPLQRQFPDAQWLGVDLSPAMLRGAVGTSAWWQRWGAGLARDRKALRICASAERLPLAEASVDLVFSNLMLHWHPAPHQVIAEIARVLRTGGLVMFSSFGPDTWKELRAACQATLPDVRPMPFVDMHDFGDMLVAAGFEAPVMEADVLQLTFGDARALLAEARALGGNPRADRARGLVSGARARSLLQRLQATGDAQGRIGLRFEIVIGHGWKAAPRPAGVSTIAMPRPYQR